MSSFVTIIPARGGSKGLIRKNLQTVGGLPLISRATRQALKAETGPVVVSSDDQDILDIAIDLGACVHKRSKKTSTDSASSESVLLEVLTAWKKIPDYVIFVQCTAPFLLAEDILGTCNAVVDAQADCGFAASEFAHFIWKRKEDQTVESYDKLPRKRRQDLHPNYREAGSVYVFKAPEFLKISDRFDGAKKVIYEIPEHRNIEIDSWEDLQAARQLAPLFDQTPENQVIYVDVDDTLCVTPLGLDYRDAQPIQKAIDRVNELHSNNRIVVWTGRGTISGEDYEEMTRQQLDFWGVRYDDLLLGKPSYDWLYDDRALSCIP